MLKLFNTLTRRLEEFKPLQDNVVRMYNCGPTVHDFAHVGNFRTFLFADLLRRYLKYKGYQVDYVMNITDIDDRIIKKANARGISIFEYTKEYAKIFLEDFDKLGGERPDRIALATDHIEEMIEIIKRLEANGHVYVTDGSVYFRIGSLEDYGKLSGLKLAGNIAGARVDVDEYDKEDARDFVLWKAARPDEPKWPSPYGEGRPGWHLECSAMAMKYLGETFDIHCGGVDLIFPHHENEIAQSEGATGKPFVRYWLHAEHLFIDELKMSKRFGNFYTLRDLIAEGFSPLAVRYQLLSVPYRKQLNFTMETLRGNETRVKKLQDFRRRLNEAKCGLGTNAETAAAVSEARRVFEDAMDDDLNTSEALAALAGFENAINKAISAGSLLEDDKQAAVQLANDFESVLGIFGKQEDEILDEDIQRLIDERAAAKAAKQYARADEIRKSLAERGILLEDTKGGTRWRRA